MKCTGEEPGSTDWTAVTAGRVPCHCDSDGNCSSGTASKESWNVLIPRRTRAQIEEIYWSVGAAPEALCSAGLNQWLAPSSVSGLVSGWGLGKGFLGSSSSRLAAW